MRSSASAWERSVVDECLHRIHPADRNDAGSPSRRAKPSNLRPVTEPASSRPSTVRPRAAPDVKPRLRVSRLLLSLVVTGFSVFLAAAIVPGFAVGSIWAALLTTLVIGLLSALLSPILAAIQLPLTLATSFLLLLALNAAILLLADGLTDQAVVVAGFWWALLAALVVSAFSTALEVIAGTNDDDAYTIRVIQQIANSEGGVWRRTSRASSSSRSTGSPNPCSSGRCGTGSSADDGALARRPHTGS